MAKRKGEAALDWWTIPHVASGVLLALLGVPWLVAFAVLVVYEVIEAGLRRVKRGGAGLFEYESWPNIGTDILVAMVGFALTWLWLPDFGVWAYFFP